MKLIASIANHTEKNRGYPRYHVWIVGPNHSIYFNKPFKTLEKAIKARAKRSRELEMSGYEVKMIRVVHEVVQKCPEFSSI